MQFYGFSCSFVKWLFCHTSRKSYILLAKVSKCLSAWLRTTYPDFIEYLLLSWIFFVAWASVALFSFFDKRWKWLFIKKKGLNVTINKNVCCGLFPISYWIVFYSTLRQMSLQFAGELIITLKNFKTQTQNFKVN